MEGLHLNVLCFFIKLCFLETKHSTEVLCRFSFESGFYLYWIKSSWNKPSFSFFLKSLVSVFSGLGNGGFTVRCCNKWVSRPHLYTCIWGEKTIVRSTVQVATYSCQCIYDTGSWGVVYKCIHHKESSLGTDSTLSSAMIIWKMLAYMQSLWG